MCGLDGRITISNSEYRPCKVEGRKALFHGWSVYSYIHTAVLRGDVSGTVANTYGIVEFEDGQVAQVVPGAIKFMDGLFDESVFGGDSQ